jgi:hypothetical protein
MSDEEIIITVEEDEDIIPVEEVIRTPIRRFVAFMKAIAADDLWEEAERHLENRGYTEILVSWEPVKAVQEFIQLKLDNGGPLSEHSRRIPTSDHPPAFPVPKFPPSRPPSGGGGDDGGAPQPPGGDGGAPPGDGGLPPGGTDPQ